MSKRALRKRRHIREAYRAEMRAASKLVAESFHRELDSKLMAVSRMAAMALSNTRPLGLLRGTVPAGQSPKLEPGEFLGMAGLVENEGLWPWMARASSWGWR